MPDPNSQQGFEGRVEHALGRIESKLDGHQDQLDDHEKRIRVTETAAIATNALALRATELAAAEARKKALLVGGLAGTVPVALREAWHWLMSTWHH
jgi:hypothetical protein